MEIHPRIPVGPRLVVRVLLGVPPAVRSGGAANTWGAARARAVRAIANATAGRVLFTVIMYG